MAESANLQANEWENRREMNQIGFIAALDIKILEEIASSEKEILAMTRIS